MEGSPDPDLPSEGSIVTTAAATGLNIIPSTSPFFPYVCAFTVATVGIGPVFDKTNPLKLSRELIAYYGGRIESHLRIDTEQVAQLVQSDRLTPGPVVDALCGMTLISCYVAVEDRNDKSPLFEFLRHCRNAAAHGNRFNFKDWEPSRAATWRTIDLDHPRKGATNPRQNAELCSSTLAPADVLALLIDVDKIIS
jgi:hypothetical protein